MGFSCEEDARRVMDGRAPEAVREIRIDDPSGKDTVGAVRAAQPRPNRPTPEQRQPPGSFDLLGFTHYWARSRNGNWVVKRTTSKSRFRRGLQELSRWCRLNRHQEITTQHQKLSQKLKGHFAYYGITGNSSALGRFRSAATEIWRHWLSRRRRGRRHALGSPASLAQASSASASDRDPLRVPSRSERNMRSRVP